MQSKKLLIFDAYGTLISTGDGSIEATKKVLSRGNRLNNRYRTIVTKYEK